MRGQHTDSGVGRGGAGRPRRDPDALSGQAGVGRKTIARRQRRQHCGLTKAQVCGRVSVVKGGFGGVGPLRPAGVSGASSSERPWSHDQPKRGLLLVAAVIAIQHHRHLSWAAPAQRDKLPGAAFCIPSPGCRWAGGGGDRATVLTVVHGTHGGGRNHHLPVEETTVASQRNVAHRFAGHRQETPGRQRS